MILLCSFVERVLLEGLMNEGHISLDLLEASDDDVPLNVLREKLNTKTELHVLGMSTTDSKCGGDISQNHNSYTVINDKATGSSEIISSQQNANVSKEDKEKLKKIILIVHLHLMKILENQAMNC